MGSSDMLPDAGASSDAAVGAGHSAMPDGAATQPSVPSGKSRKTASRRGGDGHVGNVLRSVYQSAVQEDIPAEMLDLLNKLD